jgi:hypothetical protein
MAMPYDEGHEAEMVWEPCGSCWGQRVIWRATPGTGVLESECCGGCLGVGARPVRAVRAGRGARAPR